MSATRNLYREIASMIADDLNQAAHPHTEAYRQGVAMTASRLADVLQADNPRFRYDRFFAACGLDAYGELPQ